MNLLDENFPEDQRPLLTKSKIPFREIGREVGWLGVKDDKIIPLLHRKRWVTFFTQDQGFFQRRFCHAAYCLVWLDVRPDDTAEYVRRFLRHPHFAVNAKRMGTVARVYVEGSSLLGAEPHGTPTGCVAEGLTRGEIRQAGPALCAGLCSAVGQFRHYNETQTTHSGGSVPAGRIGGGWGGCGGRRAA